MTMLSVEFVITPPTLCMKIDFTSETTLLRIPIGRVPRGSMSGKYFLDADTSRMFCITVKTTVARI